MAQLTPEARARKENAFRLKQLIVENYNSPVPISWNELARKHGYGEATVRGAVKRLKERGFLPKKLETAYFAPPIVSTPVPAPITEVPLEAPRMPSEGKTPSDEAPPPEIVEALVELDPAKRRARLDYLSVHAPPATQVRAIQLREELDRLQSVNIGPPPPETEDAMDARLEVIFRAVGPERVQRVLAKLANGAAEPNREESNEGTEAAQTTGQTESAGPPTSGSDLG